MKSNFVMDKIPWLNKVQVQETIILVGRVKFCCRKILSSNSWPSDWLNLVFIIVHIVRILE